MGSDAATQGSWQGAYGAQGYDLMGGPSSLPAYASVSAAGKSDWVWAASTADVRALQKPGANDRLAACWYASSSFSVDVNLTDGQAHQVSLYLLDWDSTARAEAVDVLDAATGAVLDSESAASFHGGQYLSWQVSGHVQFRISRTAGANAVLSGLFFD